MRSRGKLRARARPKHARDLSAAPPKNLRRMRRGWLRTRPHHQAYWRFLHPGRDDSLRRVVGTVGALDGMWRSGWPGRGRCRCRNRRRFLSDKAHLAGNLLRLSVAVLLVTLDTLPGQAAEPPWSF